MGSMGGFEWVIIILVVLLLFGAKKIPELARGLGQGINEFRKAQNDIKQEIDKGAEEAEKGSSKSGSDSQQEQSKDETKNYVSSESETNTNISSQNNSAEKKKAE